MNKIANLKLDLGLNKITAQDNGSYPGSTISTGSDNRYKSVLPGVEPW